MAGPAFGLTYKATIDTFPGTFLILVAVLSLLGSMLLFLVTWGLGRADRLRHADEHGRAEEKGLEEEGFDLHQ